ncbi:TetR family transcriptional regulator [Nocardioides sp. S5]|uniref:TetR family transcriptional regulator n=1 Tax=Nocardioides sp. S5 TaxID=2017486 RepID=UPI002414678E|nr:TetR family transcriptional regulator [Nocardioides sp. S5]
MASRYVRGATGLTGARPTKGFRRSLILRQAAVLFARQGFPSTTMDEIADASHITKRTLYRYVTSKDQLLFDIHDTFASESLVAGISSDMDPVDAFIALVRRHVEIVTEHQTEIGVFFEERKHLSQERQRLVELRRDAYERYAVALIEQGAGRDVFLDLNPRLVAQLVLGALTEMYHWYRPQGDSTPMEFADRYIDLFLRGIARERRLDVPSLPAGPLPVRLDEADMSPGERVRRAAIQEFARRGFHATSMQDLARAAGATKSAVMYHTGSKQRLLEEIHRETFSAAIAALRSVSGCPGVSPSDELFGLVAAHLRFTADRLDGVAVVNQNMRYLDGPAYHRVDELQSEWKSYFEAAIMRGIEVGSYRNVEPDFATRTVVGMLNSVALWYKPGGSLTPDDLARVSTLLLLHGLDVRPES